MLSSCNAEVTFDLGEATPGVYDLRAENTGGESAALAGALEIVAGGLGPVIDAWLTGPKRLRQDTLVTVTVHCSNRGGRETPTPLVRLRAPEGFELAVAGEGIFQGPELYLLGIDPTGLAGLLPAGAEIEIPVLVRPALSRCPPDALVGESGCDPFPSATCTGCGLRIELELLRAGDGDFVDWDLLGESTGEAWSPRWRELSSILGGSWNEVHAGLAAIATRLSRRGEPAASVRRLFRFAVRQAMGRPSAAALGQVTDDAGIGVAGVEVKALEGAIVASSALTDRFGTFALDWLESGRAYDLAVTGAAGAPTRINVPAQGDLVGVNLRVASVDATPPSWVCANCDESQLPDRPLSPPNRLFTPRGERRLRVLSAWDPNDKQGPEGDSGLLRPGSWAEYTIQFENEPTVELPARNVIIEDELDEEILDLSTLQVTGIRIADRPEQTWSFEIDTGDRYAGYSSRSAPASGGVQRSLQILQQPVGGEELPLEVIYHRELDTSDPEHPRLVFSFPTQSSDTLQGFLLPNDPAGLRQGEAQVTFAVQLKDEADIPADDDELRNKASIRFDSLAPMETRTWSNGILRGRLPANPSFRSRPLDPWSRSPRMVRCSSGPIAERRPTCFECGRPALLALRTGSFSRRAFTSSIPPRSRRVAPTPGRWSRSARTAAK